MAFLKRRFFQMAGSVLPNSYLTGFWNMVQWPALYQGSLKSICSPLLNCYACPGALLSCPIGTIQHFMVTGNVPTYAIGTLSMVGATVGRMTCGTLCPFGFMQDVLYKLRAWKVSMPVWTRWFRYLVLLVLVIIIPAVTQENWFSKLCPCGTLIGGLPWVTLDRNVRSMVRALFFMKVAMLMFIVGISTMVKRPFCRAICPLGAIFSLFNKASFVQLAWNADTCTRCGKCEKICPVDIRPDRNQTNPDCLRCLDCTRCPSIKLTTVFHRDPFGNLAAVAGSVPEKVSAQ